MATAQLLHLLADPPQAEAPDAATIISATVPWAGVLTTRLMDPAAPAVGAGSLVNQLKMPAVSSQTKSMILGRWLSRVLPAQTIGAGNWSLYGMLRVNHTTSGDATVTGFGMCIAQWRPGTGIVARFVDSPTTGTAITPTTITYDQVFLATVAGGALTLLATDCLLVEVWFTVVFQANTNARDWSFITGSAGQYTVGQFTFGTVAGMDATLKAPAAITFS